MAALAAIILACWSHGSQAQTTESIGQSDREKALEKRVNYLEERLRHVESLLEKASAPKPASRPQVITRARPKPSTDEIAKSASPDHPDAGTTPVAAASSVVDATVQSQHGSAPPEQPGVGAPDDAPQELDVLRDNSVTLKPAGIELQNELDYIYRQTSLQRDQALLSTTSIRYGLLNWLELSASIPVGYATRVSNTSPSSAVTENVSGFGDLTVQANARVVDQTANWPGIVLSLGMIAPTGPNPYNFTAFSLAPGGISNPRNPLADYYSLGSWGMHTNLQFYKTVDPIILFLGFGVDHIFPLTVSGYTVDGFNRLNYNLGFSFALSEKTTLGFSVTGSYIPDLHVNGRDVFQSSEEPTLARLTVIQRVMKNVYLEPSISFGLTQDSPNFIVGVSALARF